MGTPARGGHRRGGAPLLVTLLTCVLTSCTAEPEPPTAAASPEAKPLTEADLAGLAAVRGPFCDALDAERVAEVLGGAARGSDSYSPGDRIQVTSEVVDVARDYGCTFTRGTVTARAWVSAQPVSRGEARKFVEARRRQPDCSLAGVLEFGSPGLVQSCRPPSTTEKPGGEAGSGMVVVTMSGLFGEGWLTCQVMDRSHTRRGDDLLEGAQRWCAEVARTVATG